MTEKILIEFYDRDSMENIVSLAGADYSRMICLYFPQLNEPDRQEADVLKNFVRRRFGVPVEYVGVQEQSVAAVEQVLHSLVKEDGEYEIDITGGSELYCAAVGCYLARCGKNNVAMQHYDVLTGQRVFRYPEESAQKQRLLLSVRDVIAMHGGAILDHLPGVDANRMDPEMEREILRLWDAVSDIPRKWNHFCTLAGFTRAEYRRRQEKCVSNVGDAAAYEMVAQRLRRKGILLHEEQVNVGGKEYRVFDLDVPPQARFLYDKGGNLLEMYCALGAVRTGLFHDCRVSVSMDWDAGTEKRNNDVKNEVDVVAVNGHIPVFISCKNTEVENEYLYEIMTMTRHFGGRYAKAAIVSNARHNRALRERANEMGVVLIDALDELSPEAFSALLKRKLSPSGIKEQKSGS